MPYDVLELVQLLAAQAAPEAAGPTIPTWGWYTVVGVLASTVATLGGLYKKARDREVAAEKSKVELIEKVGDKTSILLERAIEAFTLNKTGNEQLSARLQEMADVLRELKEEVRRVGEKVR
jgi:hypothetical protein